MQSDKNNQEKQSRLKVIIHMGTSFLSDENEFIDNVPNAKRMWTFMKAFTDAGHSVCVLAPAAKRNKRRIKETGAVLLNYHMIASKTSSFSRLISQLSLAVNSLFASFRAGKADVVISTSPPALLSPSGWMIAKLKRAKLVYDVRDIWPDVAIEMNSFKKGSLYDKLFGFVRNFMLKRADLITAVSPGKVKKLSAYRHKADVELISNGFDREFLDHTEDKEIIEKYGLDPAHDCIYVGKLGLAQGVGQLMLIAGRAKEEGLPVRFLLFGTGVEEKLLQEYVKEEKLTNVLYCGGVPHRQIYTVLKNAKMSFVPLVNEKLTDSVPTKLYEALGVGCPVLLAACGDSVDVLNRSKLGVAVKPNDYDALWEAFCAMYQREYTDEEKAFSSNLMAENYSRQASAEKMVQEVYKILNIHSERK